MTTRLEQKQYTISTLTKQAHVKNCRFEKPVLLNRREKNDSQPALNPYNTNPSSTPALHFFDYLTQTPNNFDLPLPPGKSMVSTYFSLVLIDDDETVNYS